MCSFKENVWLNARGSVVMNLKQFLHHVDDIDSAFLQSLHRECMFEILVTSPVKSERLIGRIMEILLLRPICDKVICQILINLLCVQIEICTNLYLYNLFFIKIKRIKGNSWGKLSHNRGKPRPLFSLKSFSCLWAIFSPWNFCCFLWKTTLWSVNKLDNCLQSHVN